MLRVIVIAAMAALLAACEPPEAPIPPFDLGRPPPSGAWLIASPMKIKGSAGGPLRAVALVPKP